ncbi:hypothetical protein [Hyphomicrobium sp. DY-1]|uniref:hypothetical protein n=1 Tax=Hyphomicrobium sp. DY-1 TaxID=3075650 RepID=UPI0039C2C419
MVGVFNVNFAQNHIYLAMSEDPRLLIAFCHAIEKSAANGFGMLDRNSLVAIHRALMTLKDQIEDAIARFEDDEKPLN